MRFQRANKIVAILQCKGRRKRKIQEYEGSTANVREKEAKIPSDRFIESLHMQLVKRENSGEYGTKTRNNSTTHVKTKDSAEEGEYQNNESNR